MENETGETTCMKKPDHEEYENYIERLGEKFDPEYFNIDEVNKLLRNYIKLQMPHDS